MNPQNLNTEIQSLEDDEISLLDLATTLGEEKKLVFGLPAVVAVLATAVALLLPPVFTAKTTLLPPQQGGGGAAAALASLGGLAGIAGISAPAGAAETTIAMLKSRSARDVLIEQFGLMERFKAKFRDDVYAKLDAVVRVSSDKKSGTILIEVDDEDAKFAADLANAHYAVLRQLMTRVAVTEAQQRRQFFESQFTKAKEDLSAAEVKLKETSQKTGLVELKSQAEASIQAVARLRAEIAQREVQLSAMRTFATAENADYRRVAAELSGLRNELRKMENAGNREVGFVSAGSLPEQGLEYVRVLREVKYQEAIFEIMAKQYELAKVDEAKEGGNVQQLDAAVPPERKSKPRRAVIVLLSILAAGFLAVLIAFVRAGVRNSKANPTTADKLQALRRAWGLS